MMPDQAQLIASLAGETINEVASDIIARLKHAQMTLSIAESLTGGNVIATLTAVPGASSVIRGGVITYATPLKHKLLGVDSDLIVEKGVVDPEVAIQMARGVRNRTTVHDVPTTWALSTTGVAGPEPQDDKCVGTVYISVASATESDVMHCQFDPDGTRDEIRFKTTIAALGFLRQQLIESGLRFPSETSASNGHPLELSEPEIGLVVMG